MKIPADFAFSQNNLQDYVDCPRRFELRYLEKLAWPAIQTEPVMEVERHMLLGQRFHRMIQQHQSGLPAELIGVVATDQALSEWWEGYLAFAPTKLPALRKVEFTLSAPFSAYRLIAKYDLLCVEAGKKIVIVDWKTNQKKPERGALAKRIQTRVYPYLVVEAGRQLNGGMDVKPDQVEMIYWFSADPQNPEYFSYDTNQYYQDREYLINLIIEIKAASETQFILTPDTRTCRFCKFRSLCNRGLNAGLVDEIDEEVIVDTEGITDFDFEEISEISY